LNIDIYFNAIAALNQAMTDDTESSLTTTDYTDAGVT